MAIEQVPVTLCNPELERACAQFLYREAELLDDTRYEAWLEGCVSTDVEYRIPIRTTRERASGVSEFSDIAYHVNENYKGLEVRVKRLMTEHAWAEDPPSRTRRVVTNIRVNELSADEVEVKNYLMLYRSQWDTTDYDLIVADRRDLLRQEADGWRLGRRLVLLNHTILGTANLGVFL